MFKLSHTVAPNVRAFVTSANAGEEVMKIWARKRKNLFFELWRKSCTLPLSSKVRSTLVVILALFAHNTYPDYLTKRMRFSVLYDTRDGNSYLPVWSHHANEAGSLNFLFHNRQAELETGFRRNVFENNDGSL